MDVQEYLFFAPGRLEAVGDQRAERQRRRFADMGWIGTDAGNGGGDGDGGFCKGIGCVHGLVIVPRYRA